MFNQRHYKVQPDLLYNAFDILKLFKNTLLKYVNESFVECEIILCT